MIKSNYTGNYIRAYKKNMYMEVNVNKKKLIQAYLRLIMYWLLTFVFYLVIKITNINNYSEFTAYSFGIFVIVGALLIFILIYEKWNLKLENNTIIIKRRFFPTFTIAFDNLIDIQIREERYKSNYVKRIEICYLNNKNKFRKVYLTINKNYFYIVEETKIENFLGTFLHYSVNSDEYNSEWKNINRSAEEIELVEKKVYFNNLINRNASIKDWLIAFRSGSYRYDSIIFCSTNIL